MCDVNCQSSKLNENIQIPVCQTCSFCTGSKNIFSSYFSAEPHTGCGLDLAPYS